MARTALFRTLATVTCATSALVVAAGLALAQEDPPVEEAPVEEPAPTEEAPATGEEEPAVTEAPPPAGEGGEVPAESLAAEPDGGSVPPAGSPTDRAVAQVPPDPPGNNGTVKIDGADFDSHPDNEPHVGCIFQVDFYGYDQGDLNATVTFEAQPPTDGGVLLTDTVPIGEDPAGGGTDLDASETYDLSAALAGIPPHPVQGHHVRLTVEAEGSIGSPVKHKVFWVEGCTPPPTTTSTSTTSTTSTSTTSTTSTSTTTTTSTTAPTTTAPSTTTPTAPATTTSTTKPTTTSTTKPHTTTSTTSTTAPTVTTHPPTTHPPTTPPPAAGPRQPGPGAHTPVAHVASLPRTGSNGTVETIAAGLMLLALGAGAVTMARRLQGTNR